MQAGYSAAVKHLKEKHPSTSPFLATVLLLLYEMGQVKARQLVSALLKSQHIKK